MTPIQNLNSKATYATIAPENSSSDTTSTLPLPTKEDKTVQKVEAKPLEANPPLSEIGARRDFHWNHPVYTREEYQAVQVFS